MIVFSYRFNRYLPGHAATAAAKPYHLDNTFTLLVWNHMILLLTKYHVRETIKKKSQVNFYASWKRLSDVSFIYCYLQVCYKTCLWYITGVLQGCYICVTGCYKAVTGLTQGSQKRFQRCGEMNSTKIWHHTFLVFSTFKFFAS